MKPDFNPEDQNEEEIRRSLDLAQGKIQIFQGKPLWDFSDGARMALSFVRCDTETYGFLGLAYVYLLTRHGHNTFKDDLMFHPVKSQIFTNPNAFRFELLDYVNTLTSEEILEARRMMNEELKLVEISAVSPGRDKTKKSSKKKANTRVRAYLKTT